MGDLKRYAPKLSKAGLPIDARDWTSADWQDLHEGIKAIQARIATRHARRKQAGTTATTDATISD